MDYILIYVFCILAVLPPVLAAKVVFSIAGRPYSVQVHLLASAVALGIGLISVNLILFLLLQIVVELLFGGGTWVSFGPRVQLPVTLVISSSLTYIGVVWQDIHEALKGTL